MKSALKRITEPNSIWCPHRHDKVEWAATNYTTNTVYRGSFLVPIYSRYRSGPNLCDLADAVAELVGQGNIGVRFVGAVYAAFRT